MIRCSTLIRFHTLLAFAVLALALGGCDQRSASGEALAPDGVAIAWESHGTGETALVLVHGWSCDRTYWREQIPAFSQDYRVVLVDLAGHGESGDNRDDWTIAAYGADVAAVVAALDLPQVILVGHSMGGGVIAAAGRLLGDRVVGLIGVDTLHDVEECFTQEQIAGFTAPMDANFRVSTEAFAASMFPSDADTALVRSISRDMGSAPPHLAVPSIRNYLGSPVSLVLEQYRPRVRCINSDLWPTNVERGRAHCAEFEATILPGLGHFLFLEDPPRFNAALAETIRDLLS